ncbi:DMT family transporter [Paenibacillus sp. RC84]|uniref:DMT family transporter n=1 Tax=Paenibacillus sp. RC84 TaxID=3156252 RepID=UPI003517EE9F
MIPFNYILMCLIFGTTFLAIKVGIDAGASPFFSAGVRFFLAGAILFIVMVAQKKARLSLLLRKEMLLQTGMTRQKMSASSWAGCLVGFAGVVILLVPGMTVAFSTVWVAGCIAVLTGQVFYSAGTVYSRRVIRRFSDTSPIALNAAQMLYGGLMLLLLSLFTEQVHMEAMFVPEAVFSLLYLIVFGSMMGHTIFYWLVAKTNPVFPSTWLYISPLIALSLGVVLYGEPLSFLSLAGGVTIIAGILLINLKSLRQLAGARSRLVERS